MELFSYTAGGDLNFLRACMLNFFKNRRGRHRRKIDHEHSQMWGCLVDKPTHYFAILSV